MSHCHRFQPAPLTRRDMLKQCSMGFGAVAMSALAAEEAAGNVAKGAHLKKTHHAAKAKNVIFLYMDGGPSQVDLFDPKPMLDKWDGKPFPARRDKTQFDNVGNTLKGQWKFQKYGQCGMPFGDLLKNVGSCADDIAMVRSMTSPFPEHTNANYFLHTGHGIQGRPSMGAWVSYGLGSHSKNLPGFIVLNGGLTPPGGLDNFNSGFLPATYQASIFHAGSNPVSDLRRTEPSAAHQQAKMALMRRLDEQALERIGKVDRLESAIANYELAAEMQLAVPELMDLSQETAATKEAYGMNAKFGNTRKYGAQCLVARRLIERGVRFVELTCPGGNGDRWDQHGGLVDGHTKNCKTVDQPIRALIQDLKQRGMLDSTLVVWAGEFGRTPFAQGRNGRDHNPQGFSIWMAGGGIKGGTIYGATDEFGYRAVENRLEIHDLHATMLHLLGVDHERLTFRFSSRDMRLTDVHGHVIKEILA
ncbi:MAG: DUF1501 domain-containing protein [Pirellulales bacterium]|nr:DUF1501 domain-containing protein [Pirellulales bacterium]